MKDIASLIILLPAVLLIGSVVGGAVAVTEFYKQNAPTSCVESDLENQFIWLPEKVTNLFHENVLILHFSMINGHEITMNGVIDDNGIFNLHCGTVEDYDYELWMSDITAIKLATATKPTTTFVTMWRSGQIKIQPNGSMNERMLVYADQLVAQDNEPVPAWIRIMFGKFIEKEEGDASGNASSNILIRGE